MDRFIEEDPTHKVIVFGQFTSYIDLCSIFLRRKGVPHLSYVGSMKQPEREDVIKAFNAPIKNASSLRVMLISPKCVGGMFIYTQHRLISAVGLNLTAACKCIMLDLAWHRATGTAQFILLEGKHLTVDL